MTETVTIKRSYAASASEVYNAWIEVDLLTKWWGCGPNMLWTVHVWDVRIGGEIHVSMDFDGTPYEVRGRFLQLDEPHVLRYEWEGGQTITVTIDQQGDETVMTVEHAGLHGDMPQIVTAGWSASVEQILAVLT